MDILSAKITSLEVSMDKIAHRLPIISRENHFLPMLHDLLLMVNSCLNKVHTEATRIGLLKRMLVIPVTNNFASISEMTRNVHINYKVCA
jgi:hypothetical protein